MDSLFAVTPAATGPGANERVYEELLCCRDSLVPFVGAGMTVDAGFPLWAAALSRIGAAVPFLTDLSSVKALITAGDLQEAANMLHQAAGQDAFREALKYVFRDELAASADVGALPVSLLPQAFPAGPVITTNFDRFLESRLFTGHLAFDNRIIGPAQLRAEREHLIRGNPRWLVKWHGCVSAPDEVVFTTASYDKHYGPSNGSQTARFLGEFFRSRPMLFLGCSLSADRTLDLLTAIAKNDTRPHYALVPRAEDPAKFAADGRRLSNAGIRAIWYPAGQHEYVRVFLEALIPSATPGSAGSRVSPVGTAHGPTGRSIQVSIHVAPTADGHFAVRVRVGASSTVEATSSMTLAEASALLSSADMALPSADQRLQHAGERLARALLPSEALSNLASVLEARLQEDRVRLVFHGDAATLGHLPVELLRLPGAAKPLALEPGVTIRRQVTRSPRRHPVTLPGPLKVLAAVSAPDESTASGPPLNVEHEMQLLLDATKGAHQGELRILEYADPTLIASAVRDDPYHVLHLSAHGGPASLALEDEDGRERLVSPRQLVDMLRTGGKPIPLIVLSACSRLDGEGLAGALVTHGADRVIAMQASVTDKYASDLAARLYANLVETPELTVADALALARRTIENQRQALAASDTGGDVPPPEWATATLWSASEDAPLIDPALPSTPLSRQQAFPTGSHVRELPLGDLIGRRPQLRDVLGALRGTPQARRKFGAVGGVILTGMGGIGKTALAGRAIQRLRDDGWMPVVTDGAWDPGTIFREAAAAIAPKDPALSQALLSTEMDADPFNALLEAIRRHRLLILMDDFEQNLVIGGEGFRDAAGGSSLVAQLLNRLVGVASESPKNGKMLITCRYPLPEPFDAQLAQVSVPPLTDAELRRLFLRLPAISGSSDSHRQAVQAQIGDNPRLVELMDAVLRGGISDLTHVAAKLKELDKLRDGPPRTRGSAMGPDAALKKVLSLGRADILLDELLDLLSPEERSLLDHVSVCRMPLPVEDAATSASLPVDDAFRARLDRLRDLTLLAPTDQVEVHNSVAQMLRDRLADGTHARLHASAFATHLKRAREGRDTFLDMVDLPFHIAGGGQFDQAGALAANFAIQLPGVLHRIAYLEQVIGCIPTASFCLGRQVLADELGRYYSTFGDTGSARAHFEESLRIAEGLAKADPGNAGLQRGLSVSHNRLGDLELRAGDTGSARAHFEESLRIREGLAKADPGNAELQRDLSISHNRLGDLELRAGNTGSARAHFEESLRIAERLAKADPGNAELQRDLSISHNRLGDLDLRAGDTGSARAHYEESLRIAERLAKADPDDAELQRDRKSVV
ncbi:MAG: CHAT domain-containing protein [Bifidobacteriaceae bacterium]|nr:CHAT domain-containing protein [Bifidobacteriaceae bacterium]